MPASHYVQWTANEYTITFESAGGTDVASITQDFGTSVTAPTAPTKTGYTFSAWSPAFPETMPLNGDTLTATWTVNDYTLTFISDGSAVDPITQAYGSAVTAPTAPTKTGYTFSAWSPTFPETMPLNGDTLTAQWTAIPQHHSSGGSYRATPAVPAKVETPDGCEAGNKFSTTTGRNCNAATPAIPAGQVLGASTQAGQVLGAASFDFTLFMKNNSKGNEVIELQKFLNTLGYTLTADGKFGPKTKAAVIKFQIANGLKGDGVIGPLTRAVLNK